MTISLLVDFFKSNIDNEHFKKFNYVHSSRAGFDFDVIYLSIRYNNSLSNVEKQISF